MVVKGFFEGETGINHKPLLNSRLWSQDGRRLVAGWSQDGRRITKKLM